MHEAFAPTLAAAQARVAAVQPAAYARTRNALGGSVSQLSPYITHGFVTLAEVLAGVTAQQTLDVQHKFVYELGWRAYFRHVWQHRGDGILQSLHEGPLPDDAYALELPADIRQACTGVPVVDEAVRTLYATGMLHNHARMWLASYVVHVRKVHWRSGADWLYGHLLDGDLASNHLSWQWVAGTGSSKPYLFNADNVARYAPAPWHSPGSVIDQSYAALDQLARQPPLVSRPGPGKRRDCARPLNRGCIPIHRTTWVARCRGRPAWPAATSGSCTPGAWAHGWSGCQPARWSSASSWPTSTAAGPGARSAGVSSAAAWPNSPPSGGTVTPPPSAPP